MKLSKATILKLVNILTLLSFFLPFVTLCRKEKTEEIALPDTTAIETTITVDSISRDSAAFIKQNSTVDIVDSTTIIESVWKNITEPEFNGNTYRTGLGLVIVMTDDIQDINLLSEDILALSIPIGYFLCWITLLLLFQKRYKWLPIIYMVIFICLAFPVLILLQADLSFYKDIEIGYKLCLLFSIAQLILSVIFKRQATKN